MKIEVLKGVKFDPGSPSPKIISSESKLFLICYCNRDEDQISGEVHSRNIISDTGILKIEFHDFVTHKFESISDEVLHGHPLFEFGIEYYSGHEVIGSDWIKSIKKISSIHPYYNSSGFRDYRHYLLTFHDSVFECLAKSYSVELIRNESMFDVMNTLIQKISISEV